MKKLGFRSAWYSPRGFSNEGTYIYGTIEEMSAFFEGTVSIITNSVYSAVKHHKTLENARLRCERAARRDIVNCKDCGEISAISAANVENMMGTEF
jgi:hypothetical protein